MLIVQFLKGMVERRMSAEESSRAHRHRQISGDAAREGPSAFFVLMAMVSLQPGHLQSAAHSDSGRRQILMLLIEMVMRRDLSLNVKEAVFKVGFVFIMMMVAFVIYNEFRRFCRRAKAG